MKLLFVVPNIPSQVRIRPLSFLKHLALRKHTVDCVCLSIREEGESIANLATVCRNLTVVSLRKYFALGRCARSVFRSIPLRVAYFDDHQLRVQIDDRLRLEKYDLIHVEHLKSYPTLRHIRQRGAASVPLLLDMVDCLSLFTREQARFSPNPLRALWREELRRTQSLEAECLRSVPSSVTSLGDLTALQKLVPSADITVIPNGVELGRLNDMHPVRSLLFWGKLDYAPNADAARWICRVLAPAMRIANPNIRIRIGGANCSKSLRREARKAGVEMLGYFQSIAELASGSEIAIVPIRFGAGVQNKVLEAMAHGIPVVATSCATRSLSAVKDHHFLHAETADEFVQAVESLTQSLEVRKRMVQSAHCLVKEHYSWAAATSKLERLYEGVASRFDGGSA